ncbi:MAG: deoxynucleoside kinase [Candidatus Aminicenantes bacterium]|nr:deoxynucleoside kinase [Candidatus Aminicenantes bacterium]NIM85014.1 deoxynucleoside kinase [Candidatus Aminicenantes bacterium]NIN24528.1 deoxynucleoside kinase [Candidatus Aminicenantes bacterium]NIN48292.1 deoxynucleoside kinase [Candidatus Aminicenantes bacterium]NIN91195.1 deoxynucleoside kinase [Candidatus Aminicenantes bacterium]
MSEFKYVIIDGLVKSGKTRLAEILAKTFNSRLILDNTENPFLNDYYHSLASSGNAMALKTQLIFLLNRYSQQVEITQKGLFQKTTVSDYIFFRDGIYAHLMLNDEELEIYKKIYNVFSQSVVSPDLVVYLQISFTEMVRRIQQKGTEIEKSVPGEYWREVFEAYNYYFFNYRSTPLLVVNMEKVDLNKKSDVQNLVKEIKNHKKGTRYYAPA